MLIPKNKSDIKHSFQFKFQLNEHFCETCKKNRPVVFKRDYVNDIYEPEKIFQCTKCGFGWDGIYDTTDLYPREEYLSFFMLVLANELNLKLGKILNDINKR